MFKRKKTHSDKSFIKFKKVLLTFLCFVVIFSILSFEVFGFVPDSYIDSDDFGNFVDIPFNVLFSSDETYVLNNLYKGLDSYNIDFYTSDGEKLATYDTSIFILNAFSYDSVIADHPYNRSPIPNYDDNYNPISMNGHYIYYDIILPRYYSISGKNYDIINYNPILESKIYDVEGDWVLAYDFVPNSPGYSYLNLGYSSSCLFPADNSYSTFYVDGTRGSFPRNNRPGYYYTYNYDLSIDFTSDITSLDSYSYLSEFYSDPELYVGLSVICGCPYTIDYNNHMDDILVELFIENAHDLYSFLDSNNEYQGVPGVLDKMNEGGYETNLVDSLAYTETPWKALTHKIAHPLYSDSYDMYEDLWDYAAEKGRDYRYKYYTPVSDVSIKVNLNLSASDNIPQATLNKLNDLQLSIDNQTNYFAVPDNATQSRVDSLASSFSDKLDELESVSYSTSAPINFDPDMFVDITSDFDNVLGAADSDSVSSFFDSIFYTSNGSTTLVFTLVSISLGFCIISYIIFGKKV